MKPAELADILSIYADMCAPGQSSQLQRLASMLAAAPGATVAAVVKKVATVPVQQAAGSDRLGDIAGLLGPLERLLGAVAKAAAVTDRARENLPPDGAEPAYEVWRQRIQAQFA